MIQQNNEDEERVNSTHIKEEVFSCTSCSFETKNIDELDEHLLSNHENETVDVVDSDDGFQLVCEEVSKKKLSEPNFVSQRGITITKAKKHEPQFVNYGEDDTDGGPCRKRLKRGKDDVFRCGWCNYITTTKDEMKAHRKTHATLGPSTVYRCSQCPYETKRKNDMPKHMLGHCTNVEMYHCPECPYKTKRKCDLPKHLLCHKPPDSVPLYKCDYCPYVTKRKGDLPKHVMNHQEKSQLKLFNCTECEYVSKRLNDLHKHMLVHCDRHIAGVFKCLKCAYATDKVVRFSRHVQSNCRLWDEPISLEHLMLEDILASADQEDIHVVLDTVEEEEEEYQYVESQEGAGDMEQYVHYLAEPEGEQEYVQGDDANGQQIGLVEDVIESEILEEGFVPINEQDAVVEEEGEKQGVFRINLGEFSVDVAPVSSQE